MARKQKGNHASSIGAPWLHGHACAHASLLPARGQERVTVTTAMSAQPGKLHVSSQKHLRIPEDCLLVKAHVFGLMTDPRALCSVDAFHNSSSCSICSEVFVLATMSLKLYFFFSFTAWQFAFQFSKHSLEYCTLVSYGPLLKQKWNTVVSGKHCIHE